MNTNDVLLSIKDLSVTFHIDRGIVPAVSGAGFDIRRGRTLGLVGQSGCGKTVTALAIMRLLGTEAVVGGSIKYRGTELLKLSSRRMRAVRGREIAMVFQNPAGSLNPVLTIGSQLIEVIRLHRGKKKSEAKDIAAELLKDVGIPDWACQLKKYPHQLSGGMQQRLTIAMALACRPSLLIADEPTTGLDISTRAAVLELLRRIQDRTN